MNYNRIISFGCSHVEGDGLDSQLEVYSNVLANKMNMSHVNCGQSGASNKSILYNILNFDYRVTDIVVILWTHAERTTFFHQPGWFTLLNPNWDPQDKKIKFIKKYYKTYYNEYHHDVESTHSIHHGDLFLKQKNIKAYHLLQRPFENYNNNYFKDIKICNVFFSEIRHNYPKANDNFHMGKEGHAALADCVYKIIKRNNLISLKDCCN